MRFIPPTAAAQRALAWPSRNANSLFLVSLFLVATTQAQAARVAPRLVVVLAIDQFRTDYLTRFDRHFKGGFRRLLDKGAVFLAGQTGSSYNATCSGHAGILTGASPGTHGIVSNTWFDRQRKSTVYCVEDPEASSVRSPRRLLVSTVGDELKNASNGKSRVVSIALKDRAAILMGGRRANLALWYDTASRTWVTSSYYAEPKAFPEWAKKWNSFDYFEKNVPPNWSLLLPEKEYTFAISNSGGFARSIASAGKGFPYSLPKKDLSAIIASPWGSLFTLDTALEAVRAMKLGANPAGVPDILAISLSSHDFVGHAYGPYSVEIQDMTLREDRFLGEFFTNLEKLVPLKDVTLVFTADHGVSINSDLANQLRLHAGMFHEKWVIENGGSFLRKKFDLPSASQPILFSQESNVYLDAALLERAKVEKRVAARALASWMSEQPPFSAAYAREDMQEGNVARTELSKRMGRSIHSERSGDVIYNVRPGFYEHSEGERAGAEHEGAHIHDSSVPIVFLGAAFRAGRNYDEVFVNDIAPTLSAVLGIIPPNGSQGKVLNKVLTL